MAATDSSSVISDTKRSDIAIRDGGVCVLCGQEPIDVAHIVARKSSDTGQIPFIHSISPLLSGFRKDDPLNLLCLCSLHHYQYDSGWFVFVPSKLQREVLLNHELRDFAHRKSLVENGQPDPGRTFPHIPDEFEYIPVHARRFYASIHNPTRYDQEMFIFDSIDHNPCPLLHFQASPIPLMVQAQFHLATVTRLRSDKADVAASDITALLNLYQRHPGQRKTHSITVPASYSHVYSMIQQPNTHPTSHVLPILPSLPPPLHSSASAPSMARQVDPEMSGLTRSSPASTSADLHSEGPGLTPSSSATLDASKDSEVDPDIYAQADPQLLEYAKEQAVTWEDLKTRPPLFPGVDGGNWQFSSAEQIIRGEWH